METNAVCPVLLVVARLGKHKATAVATIIPLGNGKAEKLSVTTLK